MKNIFKDVVAINETDIPPQATEMEVLHSYLQKLVDDCKGRLDKNVEVGLSPFEPPAENMPLTVRFNLYPTAHDEAYTQSETATFEIEADKKIKLSCQGRVEELGSRGPRISQGVEIYFKDFNGMNKFFVQGLAGHQRFDQIMCLHRA